MNPLLLLKSNFAANLEKQGSSLLDLEESLASNNIEKVATLLKKAFAGLENLNPVDLGVKGLGTYAGLVGTGGYVGANALDSIEKSVGEENKKLQTYKDKIKLLHKLTQKVHQENL
jgi:hypothetical protein